MQDLKMDYDKVGAEFLNRIQPLVKEFEQQAIAQAELLLFENMPRIDHEKGEFKKLSAWVEKDKKDSWKKVLAKHKGDRVKAYLDNMPC